MLLYYSSSDRNVLYDTSMTAIQFLFLDESVKHRSICNLEHKGDTTDKLLLQFFPLHLLLTEV